jgi:hypothetical protein
MKILGLITLMISLSAFAGKEERDFKAATVEPALTKATAAYQTGCGCALKFDVKWDEFKNKDQMRQIANMADSISDESGKYCSSAETKKIMCGLKTIQVKHGKPVAFTFAKGSGVATLEENVAVNFGMISGKVDQ